jgi:hypothetical protein
MLSEIPNEPTTCYTYVDVCECSCIFLAQFTGRPGVSLLKTLDVSVPLFWWPSGCLFCQWMVVDFGDGTMDGASGKVDGVAIIPSIVKSHPIYICLFRFGLVFCERTAVSYRRAPFLSSS